MQTADYISLVLYLVGITVLGVYAAKLAKSMGEYFMPRKFGKAMLTMHGFGTGTHSDQAVGVASKTYASGLSGIWYQWLWLFVTPFYWLIAPMMRRFRAITTADVFDLRFGPSVAILFAGIGAINLSMNMGTMLRGSGEVVAASTGLSPGAAIAIMTLLFVIYGVAGGLSAAILTDFVQGILTIVFSFMLLPSVLSAVGGVSGIRAAIDDPQMLSLVAPAEIGIFYIALLAINGLVGIVTQPHTMGNCAAGRTEMDGRFGWTFGNFIKRVCTMAWCLTGLAAVVYFAGRDEVDPDRVYGAMAAEFLPQILPGLLGLFLAALLASVMSSCDSFMIASSALITENIYKRAAPSKPDKHYMTVGRIVALAVVVGGVAYAFWLEDVIQGIEIFWRISAMTGLAFWLGLFWRRTTTAGAWAATLTAFAVMFAVSSSQALLQWIDGTWLDNATNMIRPAEGGALEMWLPWQMLWYLSAGTVAGIVVSLVTPRVSEQRLQRYYALVRTPVHKQEPTTDEVCTLPEGVEPAPAKKLIPLKDFEIYKPSVVSVVGFLVAWALVGAMIWVFYWITQ